MADLLRRSARFRARMVVHALEAGNERSRVHFIGRYERLRCQVGKVLESARAAGTVRTDIPVEAVASLLVAADGLSTQWLLDRDVDMEASLLVLDRLLDPPAQTRIAWSNAGPSFPSSYAPWRVPARPRSSFDLADRRGSSPGTWCW